jgi:hypothetical protein
MATRPWQSLELALSTPHHDQKVRHLVTFFDRRCKDRQIFSSSQGSPGEVAKAGFFA